MKKTIKIISLCLLFSFSKLVFADVRITVSKGNASLCEIVPSPAKKYNGRNVRHYNKAVNPRKLSSDLWRSAKNGLDFFKLGKSEIESQTVQLAFVDKYSTFWYYTKNDSDVKGIYYYDFIIPERKWGEKLFVDIELENQMPCSCFSDGEKPSRCVEKNYHDITSKDKFGNWWQQTGKDSAKRIGNKIGEGSRRVWDATKGGWENIKEGWDNYQNNK